MFDHGSDFPEHSPRGGFDNFASIGLAWSDDLKTRTWPHPRHTQYLLFNRASDRGMNQLVTESPGWE